MIGSRYVPGGAVVNWPLRRRLLSRFANVYIRAVTRLSARDCTSGYRCWRREALAPLPLDRFVSDGYSFLVEMLFVGGAPGCRIAEVPITFVERRAGRIEAVARRCCSNRRSRRGGWSRRADGAADGALSPFRAMV